MNQNNYSIMIPELKHSFLCWFQRLLPYFKSRMIIKTMMDVRDTQPLILLPSLVLRLQFVKKKKKKYFPVPSQRHCLGTYQMYVWARWSISCVGVFLYMCMCVLWACMCWLRVIAWVWIARIYTLLCVDEWRHIFRVYMCAYGHCNNGNVTSNDCKMSFVLHLSCITNK